jgi:DNA modification methylase
MVRRGTKPSKGVANKSHRTSVVPLSPEERSVLDKVSACPIVRVPIQRLRPSTGHARLHSEAKIVGLVAAIRRFGFFEPLLVDQDGTIVSGVARWMAGQEIGLTEVPVIVISHLSAAEVRALTIAVGRFPEWATWDQDQLRVELPAIVADLPDLSMEQIGFTVQEVDRLIAPPSEQDRDPADEIPDADNSTVVISRVGDLWRLGQHLVLCGDALESESYDRLLGSTAVRMVLTDPPYNVRINGHVTKRVGKFDEFVMASGEMTNDQFCDFLRKANVQIARVSVPGAIAYFFIDWRHARIMQEAADGVFFEFKNHIVWVKDAPALGTFYRSQHEFVLVFKIANGKHINNFALGQHGRTRSNVWQYPGMSSFGSGRDQALELHATPKPVAMLVDAILDCSNPGDLVLDLFGGSGSTLIAAQRAHRRARLIEISPTYVDTIVRRWEQFTGEQAVLVDSNQTFAEVTRHRVELGDASTRMSRGQQDPWRDPAVGEAADD